MDKRIVFIAAAIIAIGAFPLPYGYYTLLRIVACIVFGLLSYGAFIKSNIILGAIAALFAIVFNPIIPVYLSKDVWTVIDIVGAISVIAINHFIKD